MGVALNLSVSVENSQKLYEVQKAKTLRQKSPTQLERMQKKITEVRPVCEEAEVAEIELV